MQDEIINEADKVIKESVENIDKPTKALYHYGAQKGKRRGKIECANTYRLQLTSLHMFASALGYMYSEENEADGGSFMKLLDFDSEGNYTPTDKLYISTNTMVRYYNTNFMPLIGHGVEKELPSRARRLKFDLASMQRAIEGKLTKRVYLQTIGHGIHRRIQVMKHLIEFA